MKKLMSILSLLLLLAVGTFAQNDTYLNKLKRENVPDAVLSAIAKDFPAAQVGAYFGLPVTMLNDQIFVYAYETMDQSFDTFIIKFSGENGSLRATYDKGGRLLSKSEKMREVRLPHAVELAIGKNFPGWAVTGDKLIMTSVNKGKEKNTLSGRPQKGQCGRTRYAFCQWKSNPWD